MTVEERAVIRVSFLPTALNDPLQRDWLALASSTTRLVGTAHYCCCTCAACSLPPAASSPSHSVYYDIHTSRIPTTSTQWMNKSGARTLLSVAKALTIVIRKQNGIMLTSTPPPPPKDGAGNVWATDGSGGWRGGGDDNSQLGIASVTKGNGGGDRHTPLHRSAFSQDPW